MSNIPTKSAEGHANHRAKRHVRHDGMDYMPKGRTIPAVKTYGIRPGKTQRDRNSGALSNHATNRANKAQINREARNNKGRKGK